MVFAGLPEGAAAPLQKHLLDRGILINRGEPQIRLVTHLDCRADEIDLFVEEVQGFFA
jgi:threonine aldolase